MIPGQIFTCFAEFQGNVSVNDLRLPIRAPIFFASSFVFPEKFWSCTDMPGSIGLLSLVPRVHIGDGFEIRSCH